MFKSIINWLNQPMLQDDTNVAIGPYVIKHKSDLQELMDAGYTLDDMANMRVVGIKDKIDPEDGTEFSVMILESIPGHRIQGWINMANQFTMTGYLVPTPWMRRRVA